MDDEQPAFLTPPAVARLLGINVAKVLTWIRNGDLRAVNVATRLGGRARWRIRRADLEAFLVSRENRPRVVRPPRRRPRPDPNIIEFIK
ncbi:MAG TPA: helix-turn-helix domain-containing protein [Pirellulales bacterium]|nr:helix-turn-helix domain-containing protein [Pirellulales bacterium]